MTDLETGSVREIHAMVYLHSNRILIASKYIGTKLIVGPMGGGGLYECHLADGIKRYLTATEIIECSHLIEE